MYQLQIHQSYVVATQIKRELRHSPPLIVSSKYGACETVNVDSDEEHWQSFEESAESRDDADNDEGQLGEDGPRVPAWGAAKWALSETNYPVVSTEVMRLMSETSRLVSSPVMDALQEQSRVLSHSVLNYANALPHLKLSDELTSSIFAASQAAQSWVGAEMLRSLQWTELVGEFARNWLSGLNPIFEAIGNVVISGWDFRPDTRLPSNFDGSTWVTLEDVRDFLFEDGIPLLLIPQVSVAQELLVADTRRARREVMDRRRTLIIDDCEALVSQCAATSTKGMSQGLLHAIEAFRDGHHSAAQALAANTLDTVIRHHFDNTAQQRYKGKADNEIVGALDSSEYLLLLPLWHAYKRYQPGDAVPAMFNRHASAHAVGSRQFTRRNTIQAIMLATSVLGHVNGLK